MGEFLVELLLPRTDTGAISQVIVVVPLCSWWIWRVRDNHDHRLFATGVLVFALAWFSIRTLH